MTALRFRFGQIVAWFFRLGSLRLARIVFRGVGAPTVLSMPFYGHELFMDVSRSSGPQLLWLQGKRHVKERSLLETLARPGMAIVDVGANIGYYALILASLAGPEGRVICLEPDPDNLRELNMNVRNNRLERNVVIKSTAAGDFEGTIGFEAGTNGRVTQNGEVTVQVTKLDSLGLAKCDAIKVDVEGYEGAVLDGARETIEKFRPAIFLELHPDLLTSHTHGQIVSFLRERYSNLSAYRPTRGNLVTKTLCAYNFLSPLTEAKDIGALVDTYESRTATEPCWIIARA